MSTQWVIAETAALAAELIGGLRDLEDGVLTAFVGVDATEAKTLIALGADRVVALAPGNSTPWEDYVFPLVDRARTEAPDLVLVGATRRGRGLAAFLAASLDAPLVSDAKALSRREGRIQADRMVLGGLAVKTVSTDAATVIATVAAGVYAARAADLRRSGPIETLEPVPGRVRVTGRRLKDGGDVNLAGAKRVVGVGRGFADKADLALAEALATALGAELACSRPIAEFFKWMPEERYIGISGQAIKPDLYIAVGISGQAQHVYGIRDAKVIVSINKDETAPIGQKADYSIVGDLKEVLPVLTGAL